MQTESTRNTSSGGAQSAYGQNRIAFSTDVDSDISQAMQLYLISDLGIDPAAAAQRSAIEVDRIIPKSVISQLESHGVLIEDRRVLDLGAGLGGLSEELLLCGAKLFSLEPGEAWALLTKRRLERHSRAFELLHSGGESIPLPNNSVDLIISLQVLEHVRDPAKVLSEAFRVLRPGGHFLLACENYLAFWEPHYKIMWFPLLPKPIGSLYLRLRGRSPKFLNEAITYTTLPTVLRVVRRLGFIRLRDEEINQNLRAKPGMKWALLRAVSRFLGAPFVRLVDDAGGYFKVGIHELLRKPEDVERV